MSYSRTQVYLDADEHRRLSEAASRQGKSLTGLVREIVSSYLETSAGAAESCGLDAIFGIAAEGEETDIASQERTELDIARRARAQKKLGQRK